MLLVLAEVLQKLNPAKVKNVKNDSPSRVDNREINKAPEASEPASDPSLPISEEKTEEGLGLLGIGDVNVNLDASGQNNAVGVNKFGYIGFG
jgi:hypothetical protein